MASTNRVAHTGQEVAVTWRRLGFEQRVAGIGAVLLIVSTFGPFSFVEAAELLTALGVLALLRARALGKRFHLPFGDGTVITAAGAWAGLLIVVRLFDRSLGQNLLALVCAAILVLAGLRESAKRPADDVPPEPAPAEEQPTAKLPAQPRGKSAEPAEQLTLPETELADGGGADAPADPDQGKGGESGDELRPGGEQDRLG